MNGMNMAAYTVPVISVSELNDTMKSNPKMQYKIGSSLYTYAGVSGENENEVTFMDSYGIALTVLFSPNPVPPVFKKSTMGGRRRKSKKTRRPKRKHNKSRKH